MDILCVCRALLCGAILLATSARAAPDAPPPACLAQPKPPGEEKPAPPAPPPPRKLFSPCYLADAEELDDETQNDGAPPKDDWELVNEAIVLSRLAQAPDTQHALGWSGRSQEDIPPIPEPSHAALLLAGLAVVAGALARKRRISGGKAPPAVHR